MLAQFEHRIFQSGSRLWICAYAHLQNLPHWHLEPEIIALQEGSAVAMLGDARYDMQPGDVILCPPDVVHSLRTEGECRLFVMQYERDLFPPLYLKSPIFQDTYHVIPHLNQVYTEIGSGLPMCEEKALCVARGLLIDILRHEEHLSNDRALTHRMQHFEQLLHTMENDQDALDFAGAAQFMNMSEGYFCRFFKQMVGMNFSRYVNVLRVDRALDVLAQRPQITMAELMRLCGFNSLRNLNRVFKDITGHTPTQLPAGYSLHHRSLVTASTCFDPTLEADTLPPMAG